MLFTIELPESERTPLVNWLLNLVAEQKLLVENQQQVIENQQDTIAELERKVEQLSKQVNGLDEELKAIKKLKSKPKISPSTLNQEKKTPKEGEKRAGSQKRSKKISFVPDEERFIEPEEIPSEATFNGYREYDVQDLIIQRHNIRFRLGEYVTTEGKTVVGKLPSQYQGHYGPTLIAFTLYQHHQCRVPQTLILEELRELGIDISAGQVNRILIENKEPFHWEQEQVFAVGLETAKYVHTDDTGARHQGHNGFCTVIGNDLFTYFRSTNSKSRENYLRMLRGHKEDFVLNEYSRSYLEEHQLAASHLAKLQFSSQVISQGDEGWSQYLERLGITSTTAVKLVTEAAVLGSAIEGGVSPELIVLSDRARQFAILVHALCWVHAERGIRRLPGATAQQRQNIAEVTEDLWDYYQELKAYQQQPTSGERERLHRRFDEIFGRHYPHHVSLNLALQQFCAHKQELLRVLDTSHVPLHTNAAESDIREYVTRRKISGGTRHDEGRRARDTFTGLKKTCRKLAVSFWEYLLSRCLGNETISSLPDIIRVRAAPQNSLGLEAGN